jgi:hypothetical protein
MRLAAVLNWVSRGNFAQRSVLPLHTALGMQKIFRGQSTVEIDAH